MGTEQETIYQKNALLVRARFEQREQGGGACPGGGGASTSRLRSHCALLSREDKTIQSVPFLELSAGCGPAILSANSTSFFSANVRELEGSGWPPKHTKMQTKQTKGKRTKGDQTQPNPNAALWGFGAFPVSLKHVLWPTNSVWVQILKPRCVGLVPTVLYLKGPGRGAGVPSVPARSRADWANGLRWRPLLLSAGQRPLLPAAPALRRSLQRSTLSEPELEIFCELLKQQTFALRNGKAALLSPAPPAGRLRNRQKSTCCLCIFSWWEG